MTEGGSGVYNLVSKEEFLDRLVLEGYNDRYIKIYKGIFEKTEPFEEKYKKDIRDFNVEELISMYDELGLKAPTKITYNSKLNTYASKYNGNLDAFKSAKKKIVEETDSIKKEKLRTVSCYIVRETISKFLNASDKFMVYGIFCGLWGKDFVEIMLSSMRGSDEKKNIIWLAGYEEDIADKINLKSRLFEADQELFQYASEAAQEKTYRIVTQNGIVEKNLSDLDNQRIVKMTMTYDEKESKSHRSTLLRRYMKLVSGTEMEHFLPDEVRWSGIVYNIRKLEVETGNKIENVEDVLELPGFDKIKKQYNIQMEERSFLLKLERYL